MKYTLSCMLRVTAEITADSGAAANSAFNAVVEALDVGDGFMSGFAEKTGSELSTVIIALHAMEPVHPALTPHPDDMQRYNNGYEAAATKAAALASTLTSASSISGLPWDNEFLQRAILDRLTARPATAAPAQIEAARR